MLTRCPHSLTFDSLDYEFDFYNLYFNLGHVNHPLTLSKINLSCFKATLTCRTGGLNTYFAVQTGGLAFYRQDAVPASQEIYHNNSPQN